MGNLSVVYKACAAAAFCVLGAAAFGAGNDAAPAGIKSAVAITEIFGDGQKVSAVALEYSEPVKTASLKAKDFAVEGKTVVRVYANTAAAKVASRAVWGVDGAWVIIELDTSVVPSRGFGAAPAASDGAASPPPGAGGPKLGSSGFPQAAAKPLSASVVQKSDIAAVSGAVAKASPVPVGTTRTIDLMLDGFRQLVYVDPAYPDRPLKYNLFVPRNYDSAKKYPLVLFMHDAGEVGGAPTAALTQGLGAVVWATPEEQAKRECFVLAPQYDVVIADDDSETTPEPDITVHLLKDLMKSYSIDPARLYDTGQSMGGMVSIHLDSKYPGLFAASLLVACQWDVAKIDAAAMAKMPLWIIVSEGDNKAMPGQTAITDALKAKGAKVAKARWSAMASPQGFAAFVKAVLAKKANVNFTAFEGGNHPYTWQYAYSIEGVRDWLFEQAKR